MKEGKKKKIRGSV